MARRFIACCSAAFLLAGCAADSAYREGKQLVAQGRVEEGLGKFQEALAQDPGAVQYKMAYSQTRERALASFVALGDREASAGNTDAAAASYKRALAIDGTNERALAGLRALEKAPAPVPTPVPAAAAASNGASQNGSAGAKMQTAVGNDRKTSDSMLSVAYKKPLSIEFKDVSLKQVFEVISRSSGLNFLFDKDVKVDQKVNVFLKNSTIESVVYYTLLTNQLEQQILNENTILVYPNTSSKIKDYQEMMVRTFYLTNADAKVVANTLKTIVKTRDIVVDDKLNMLIVRDNPEGIRLASRLVALHDVAEPEVMLEVEILEIKRNKLMDLGIQWPDSLSLSPLPSAAASAAGGVLTLRDLRGLNSSTIAAGIGATVINARRQDADANILANPRIRARNHEKAKIMIGDRLPIITTTSTATGFAAESVSYIDVGLKLDVEPSVHLNSDVAIKISLEVSSIVNQITTKTGSIAYQIGTRTASTVLRLKDGENQVLAGLINDEDRRTARKVPGLGELPIIGRLFGSTLDESQKTEIVLSITPHLVRNIEQPPSEQSQFHSGTENSFRVRPEGMNTRAAPSPLITLSEPDSPTTQKVAASAGPTATAAPRMTNVAAPAPASPAGGNAAAAGQPDGAKMNWDGVKQLKVGDTFTLHLAMQSGLPVTSVPLAITYDQNVFAPDGVSEGGFLGQGGVPTNFDSKVAGGGQILVTGTRADASGATGSGNFVDINFRAIAPAAASAIQLLTAAPVGIGGSVIPSVPPAPHMVQVLP